MKQGYEVTFGEPAGKNANPHRRVSEVTIRIVGVTDRENAIQLARDVLAEQLPTFTATWVSAEPITRGADVFA